MAEYDVDKAITHLDAHAGPNCKGKCAKQGGRMIHCVDNSVRFGSRSAVSFC
jgi:hypothetical protein